MSETVRKNTVFADKVLEILCNAEGTAVSSGLSKYFGDSDETVSEAIANERGMDGAGNDAAAALGGSGHASPGQLLLSGVLSPPEVGVLSPVKE